MRKLFIYWNTDNIMQEKKKVKNLLIIGFLGKLVSRELLKEVVGFDQFWCDLMC